MAKSNNASSGSHSVPAQATGDTALQRLRRLVGSGPEPDVSACLALIHELSASDCRAALDLFHRWPSDERHVIQRLIARRWASLAPEDLLQAIPQTREAESWNVLSQEAARELIRRDPEAALHKLSRLGGFKQLLLVHHAVTILAEKDPARAAAFLLSRPEYARDEDAFGVVGRQWAKNSPDAALAWANSLPNGRARREAVRSVWTSWGEGDPATVAAAIAKSPDTRFERQVFESVARHWSQNDPAATLAWIEKLSRKEERDAAWQSFQLDARKMGGDAAFELLRTVSSEQRRAEIAIRVTSELARENIQTALSWAERFPAGPLRNQALRPALEEWAASEPTRAVAYAAALPADESRTELLRRMVATWAQQDPDVAMQWSRRLPEGAERDDVLVEAARNLRGMADPVRAAQWLDQVQNPAKRQSVVPDLTGEWARINGAAAAEWLGRLPDANSQINGHHQLARQWAFVDPDATELWMGSLPAGAARDAAIGAFVETMDGYDPALATAWAAAIGQSSEREKNIRSAFQRWLERDAAAARNWLEGTKLSESLRGELARASEERIRSQPRQ